MTIKGLQAVADVERYASRLRHANGQTEIVRRIRAKEKRMKRAVEMPVYSQTKNQKQGGLDAEIASFRLILQLKNAHGTKIGVASSS